MNSFICKVCGEVFLDTSPSNVGISPQSPPLTSRCGVCGRYQNWFGTAKQPTWWPTRLKTIDRLDRQWRWTNWVVALAVASIVLYSGVGTVVNIIDSATSPDVVKELVVPNMSGMNLQAAQDCLQELGFWNLDDQPAPGESRFQVNDSNWTVTSQNRTGKVDSEDVMIVLYSKNTGGGGNESCPSS